MRLTQKHPHSHTDVTTRRHSTEHPISHTDIPTSIFELCRLLRNTHIPTLMLQPGGIAWNTQFLTLIFLHNILAMRLTQKHPHSHTDATTRRHSKEHQISHTYPHYKPLPQGNIQDWNIMSSIRNETHPYYCCNVQCYLHVNYQP